MQNNYNCHSRLSAATAARREGNLTRSEAANRTSWIPFPRIARSRAILAGDDKKGSLALIAFAALLATPAFADMSTDPETVVVTATRTPQPLDLTGTSMSVITTDDLNIQQTAVVTDILAETPGLMVNRAGGVGQPTSISLRGAETGQTVVLIDGVRINDPSATDEGAILSDVLVKSCVGRNRRSMAATRSVAW